MEQQNSGGKTFYILIAIVATILLAISLFYFLAPLKNRQITGMNNHNLDSGPSINNFYAMAGKQAPEFELHDMNDNTIRLSDYKGKNIILFFNEGAMCYPSCWDQIAALGSDKRLNNDNSVAFSIVVDGKEQWQKIISRVQQLSDSKILFDTDRKASSEYNVLNLASSMHKGSYPGHTYFLIDKNGIVRFVLDDPDMAIRNEQLFSELKKISDA